MIGIVDFDVAFPAERMTVERMHELSGRPVPDILAWTHCAEIPVFGDYDEAWELAADVARKVLDRAGVGTADIGQVIMAGGGDWDYPGWSPSAKVADALGITGAHCFEVVNFCTSSSTALQAAVDAVSAGRVRYALVLFGERASRAVDYTDPESVSLFNTGDCAGAVLIGSEDVRYEFLGARMRTDPSWCDFYVGEYVDDRVVTRRRGNQLKLAKVYLDNYRVLVAETLAALGNSAELGTSAALGTEDIAYLLINQMDRRMHERLLRALDLPDERTVFNYDRYGHMGCCDPFIALSDLDALGRLRPGELVLLATSGVGFSWGITALRRR
ncbi:3-oxoacyl-[acyl-carrier-protein] synthase III C-terminal domain-containing protein [Actinokineospora sp. NBRC 105648]|uniref:3-oxoacyl-ACP synthase III family protein n=1 Tax=Actinokineospora sp. NBRC 105648 TaxID=3032206 RepID=UPI0024A230EE|nr:3-oxoacyl-[acyl-carrier-protein] synthase III C-terminal domain-containing protein [Actinokineospora sp. NBRC 105648]GLZ39691.1 3-oxoacyl-[acyl-carrier-protein] synthase 3 [Actinokineospora sp. NBRC 105648]